MCIQKVSDLHDLNILKIQSLANVVFSQAANALQLHT